MPVESATYISQLDVTKPSGSDSKAEGDDQLRLLKSTVKATFPNFSAAPLNATQAQIDKLVTAVVVNASAPANSATIDASGRIVVAGSVATGRVTLTSSYVGVNPSATDGNVISFRNKTSGTQSVGIVGGIFADCYRDVRDPAYAAGVWFERTPTSGGLSSGGAIKFGTWLDPESTVLPPTRMVIASDGRIAVNGSTFHNSIDAMLTTHRSGASYCQHMVVDGSGGGAVFFSTAGTGGVGNIVLSASTTSYNTTSDYRLKRNPRPLTGSGAFIDALKPKTWSWAQDGSRGAGFIAHEFQEVSPTSVTGEKGAVDADGKPVFQSMQASSPEVMANIVAELQSLRARVAALEAA